MLYKDIGIQGWILKHELDFLYNQMLQLHSDSVIIEIGCWKGRSSHAIASGIRDSGRGQLLYSIDTFEGAVTNPTQRKRATEEDVMAEFTKNMIEFDNHVIVGDSADSAKQFNDNSVDWLFLDANHDYEYASKDIDEWLPKIKPGGIFCGHDYKDGYKGVKQAVDERFSSVEFFKDSIWLIRRVA